MFGKKLMIVFFSVFLVIGCGKSEKKQMERFNGCWVSEEGNGKQTIRNFDFPLRSKSVLLEDGDIVQTVFSFMNHSTVEVSKDKLQVILGDFTYQQLEFINNEIWLSYPQKTESGKYKMQRCDKESESIAALKSHIETMPRKWAHYMGFDMGFEYSLDNGTISFTESMAELTDADSLFILRISEHTAGAAVVFMLLNPDNDERLVMVINIAYENEVAIYKNRERVDLGMFDPVE